MVVVFLIVTVAGGVDVVVLIVVEGKLISLSVLLKVDEVEDVLVTVDETKIRLYNSSESLRIPKNFSKKSFPAD